MTVTAPRPEADTSSSPTQGTLPSGFYQVPTRLSLSLGHTVTLYAFFFSFNSSEISFTRHSTQPWKAHTLMVRGTFRVTWPKPQSVLGRAHQGLPGAPGAGTRCSWCGGAKVRTPVGGSRPHMPQLTALHAAIKGPAHHTKTEDLSPAAKTQSIFISVQSLSRV